MSEARRPVDERWMRRALRLAAKGRSRVSPNPMVGAVVVAGDVVIGEGYHRRHGGPHAEVLALQAAGARSRGAVLYVTLEPCNHHGKTPPCVDAVRAAGIAEVVIAMTDPNPNVAGDGRHALSSSGVVVRSGVLQEAAVELNRSYVKQVTTGKPFVTLKSATSIDGCIATAGGESQWISGTVARAWSHRLRRDSDAVLVGIGTVLADDPRLTARVGTRRPKSMLRAVLDSTLRMSPGARLLQEGEGTVVVYTTERAPAERAAALSAAGATLVRFAAASDGHVDLELVLRDLGMRGVGRLLVEGGSGVAASLLRAGEVDRLLVVMAPLILGADAIPVVGKLATGSLAGVQRWRLSRLMRLGEDVLLDYVRNG